MAPQKIKGWHMLIDINAELANKLALLASDNGHTLEEYVEHLLTKTVVDLGDYMKGLESQQKSETKENAGLRSSDKAA